MALLRIPEQDRTLTESGEIAAYLSERGIDYERLEGAVPAAPSSEEGGEVLGLEATCQTGSLARARRSMKRRTKISK